MVLLEQVMQSQWGFVNGMSSSNYACSINVISTSINKYSCTSLKKLGVEVAR